jgi:DNA-directed RNA polymerase subunit RPC12/RpoP
VIRFNCASCGKSLKAPEDNAGAKAKCPKCGAALRIPPPIRVATELVPVEPRPPSVPGHDLVNDTGSASKLVPTQKKASAEVPCPHCRALVPMSADQINRGIRCSSCFRDFVVSLSIHATGQSMLALPIPEPVQPVAIPSPAPPKVVVSVPPPSSQPAKARDWVQVCVSARLLHWPRMCTCCNGTFDVTRKVVYRRVDSRGKMQERWWEVPYCRRCSDSIDTGAAGESVRYDNFSGSVHTFRFWSPEYAQAFQEQNRGKLVGW